MERVLVWRSVVTAAGEFCVAYTDEGLYALEFPGEGPSGHASVGESEPAWLVRLANDLVDYFAGRRVEFCCPLDSTGYPPFFKRVLTAAMKIPYGECSDYRRLAAEAGSPKAFRAAGQAMAHNRTPVVVPCHRVLRSDGGLGGFSGGLSWKRRLLSLEAAGGGQVLAGAGGKSGEGSSP